MPEPEVEVSIQIEDEINFELNGIFSLPNTKEKFSGRFRAYIENENLIISGKNKSIKVQNAVLFAPSEDEPTSVLIKNVKIGKEFHWEKTENQRFSGALKIFMEGNKINAVNIVPLEDYLASVISSEMSSGGSRELLKAHAIVSRSWLIAQMEKRKAIGKSKREYKSSEESVNERIVWYDREDHKTFDVCADDHCQRYQGITKIVSDQARRAVEKTHGMVINYNNKICDTRFSKCCGGTTESFENVWENIKHPYLTSVIDYKFEPDGYLVDLTKETQAERWINHSPPAFCNTTDNKILSQVLQSYDQNTKDFYRWKVRYTQEELRKIIEKKSGIDFGEIKDLIPVERGHSARLIKLKIEGTKKTLTLGKELEIRRILSESHLYSSAFIIKKQNIVKDIPQKFTLIGAGWGHGVGLCQIGAAVMSEMGYQFDEILLHYFKNSTIKKIY